MMAWFEWIFAPVSRLLYGLVYGRERTLSAEIGRRRAHGEELDWFLKFVKWWGSAVFGKDHWEDSYRG